MANEAQSEGQSSDWFLWASDPDKFARPTLGHAQVLWETLGLSRTDRKAWLDVRRTGLGGSDLAKVVEGDTRELWLEKVRPEVAPSRAPTLPMRLGTATEELNAELYQEFTGLGTVELPMVRHPKHSFVLASMDRGAVHPDTPSQLARILECKRSTAMWVGRWDPEEPPIEYLYQVHWYMLAAGIFECDLGVILGDTDYRVYSVRYDAELADLLLDVAGGWWERHVVGGDPPPVTASESSRRALQRQYWQNRGDYLTASAHQDNLAGQLAALKASRDSLDRQMKLLENQLRDEIKDHDGIEGATWKASWKAPAQGKISWKAACEAMLKGQKIDINTYRSAPERSFRFTTKK